MEDLLLQIERVAPTDATILLVGESGTGKELVAQTIHRLSRRKDQRFLAINCGAISQQLVESELFGHEKGSFTGATAQHAGYFEQADEGTLFLDEITEMPLDLQVKLLRVLEAANVQRIGGTELIPVDVRIVAATNRDPFRAVKEGRLREDLYYRLQVFPLEIPPLRKRHDDIEELARHFVQELNAQAREEKRLSESAITYLNKHDWPGNVRELKNVLKRAFILAQDTIRQEDIKIFGGASGTSCAPSSPPVYGLTPSLSGDWSRNGRDRVLKIEVGSSIEDVEEDLIVATLEKCGGNKKKAAKILGISFKTLYNRLHRYEERENGDAE